jgi:hypothetical protein
MNNLELLVLTLVITMATLILMDQPQWTILVEKLRLPEKPFLCATCLPMWTTLAILLLVDPQWTAPIYALAAAWIGTQLHRHNNTF